jgi:hypothetical protein
LPSNSNLPFSFVDNPIFYKIFEYFNAFIHIQEAIPIGATIRQSIYKYYTNYQQHIINLFRDSFGKIYIYFDGWTSFNQYALYGIMCFFRKPDNTLCKLLLGVPETIRHFGNFVAGEVL